MQKLKKNLRAKILNKNITNSTFQSPPYSITWADLTSFVAADSQVSSVLCCKRTDPGSEAHEGSCVGPCKRLLRMKIITTWHTSRSLSVLFYRWCLNWGMLVKAEFSEKHLSSEPCFQCQNNLSMLGRLSSDFMGMDFSWILSKNLTTLHWQTHLVLIFPLHTNHTSILSNTHIHPDEPQTPSILEPPGLQPCSTNASLCQSPALDPVITPSG